MERLLFHKVRLACEKYEVRRLKKGKKGAVLQASRGLDFKKRNKKIRQMAAGDNEAARCIIRAAIAFRRGKSEYTAGRYAHAAPLLWSAVLAEHPVAMYMLADMEYNSKGIAGTKYAAIQLLDRSARQEYPPACLTLGIMHMLGKDGLLYDLTAARRLVQGSEASTWEDLWGAPSLDERLWFPPLHRYARHGQGLPRGSDDDNSDGGKVSTGSGTTADEEGMPNAKLSIGCDAAHAKGGKIIARKEVATADVAGGGAGPGVGEVGPGLVAGPRVRLSPHVYAKLATSSHARRLHVCKKGGSLRACKSLAKLDQEAFDQALLNFGRIGLGGDS